MTDRRPLWRLGCRAAVAPMTALLAPAMIGMAAMIVDAGFWITGSLRLQIAADAAAMGAGFLLSTSLKSADSATQTSTLQSVALYEAQAAATKLTGTINTPLTVTPNAGWTSVTVTVTSTPVALFGNAFLALPTGGFRNTPPTLRATATASLTGTSTPCVLTTGTTGTGIKVDNMGTVSAANCTIASNAKDANSSIPSIYLDSGTISANSINAAGTISKSNSGSNTMTGTQNQNQSAYSDPYASQTTPSPGATPGACDVAAGNANYSSYGTYSFDPSKGKTPGQWVFCGDTTIGGNGSTDSFAPGIYYVVNGNLTFNNATLTNSSGITFVMTGTNPGNFSWTNYSNTSIPFSAPTTGPTAGFAIWQACNSSGTQTSSFQGGSTVVFTGTVYMPCSSVDAGNNAQIRAPLGKAFNMVAKSMYVHGSAAIVTSPKTGSGSGTGTVPVLTQ